MTTNPVSIVVVGAGIIGPRHAEAIQKCPSAVLAGLIDLSPATHAVADLFNVPFYTSIAAMLASTSFPKPDAAIVCTPNHTHVTVSQELLAAGIHVLVEKPISTSIDEGKLLVEYAKKCQLTLLVGHHRRFNPYVVSTKRALLSQAVGQVIAVNGLWMLKKPASYYEAPMAWHASAESGGTTRINLVHEIDILQHLLGPITRVFAEASASQRGNPADEGAAIVLRFASGVVGTFLLGDATPSGHNFESGTGENPMIPRSGMDFYRVFGTEGVLSVPGLTVSRAQDWTQVLSEESLPVDAKAVPFELQIQHFVNVVRELEEPSCSGEAGLSAVVVCEAVTEAIRTGLPVNIAQ